MPSGMGGHDLDALWAGIAPSAAIEGVVTVSCCGLGWDLVNELGDYAMMCRRIGLWVFAGVVMFVAGCQSVDMLPQDPLTDRSSPCSNPAAPDHRDCNDKALDDYVADGPMGPIKIER